MFDTTGPDKGTLGSDHGKDFDWLGSGDATADYSDSLAITGDAAVGDLYLQLDVALTESLAAGASATFMQDTDNALIANDITTVPEPSTGLGIGLLLSSAFFMRRRK